MCLAAWTWRQLPGLPRLPKVMIGIGCFRSPERARRFLFVREKFKRDARDPYGLAGISRQQEVVSRELPASALVLQPSSGSFDSALVSLRSIRASLRMTGLRVFFAYARLQRSRSLTTRRHVASLVPTRDSGWVLERDGAIAMLGAWAGEPNGCASTTRELIVTSHAQRTRVRG